MLRRSLSASRIIAIGEPSGEGGGLIGGGRVKRNVSMELEDEPTEVRVDSTLPRMMAAEEGPFGSLKKNQQLLQRVLQLQSELQRREEEVVHLKEIIKNKGSISRCHEAKEHSENAFQEALARAHDENECLRGELLKSGDRNAKKRVVSEDEADEPKCLAPPHAHLNEIVYETFFKVCTEEMETLNRRMSNLTVRDYSDIFGEMHKILHEPFSFRLMEINSKCALVFESMSRNLKPCDREQLYTQFDHFLKQKIFPISKPLDSFLSTLRESAGMARESARACTVFSQWSREFGDQLQLQPNWELMLYKVRDLQTRFREQGLPKHWLPPSLMPLLEVLIIERKNWAEEKERGQQELATALAKASQKIVELESQLERKLLANVPQISLPSTDDIEMNGIKLEAQNLAQSLAKTTENLPQNLAKDPVQNLTRDNSVPRIELPAKEVPIDEESAEKIIRPRSPRALKSPSSARSARGSQGSLKLLGGESEDEDSANLPEHVAHINSPNTPPPSHRIVPKPGQRILTDQENEIDQKEVIDDEKPWGDQKEANDAREERKEDSDENKHIEEQEQNIVDEYETRINSEDERKEEENEGNQEKKMSQDSGRMTKARAIRTAIVHLNQVYDELVEHRAKSRAASPAEANEQGQGHDGLLGIDSSLKAVRAKSAMARRSTGIWEKPRSEKRAISLEEGHSDASVDSNETLVKEESESEEDEQKGQTALLHLFSYYKDLDEQRRKSQSTVDGDAEEDETIEEELENLHGNDEENEEKMREEEEIVQKTRENKIARAENALLLANRSFDMDMSPASSEPLETVREASKEAEEDGQSQLEFERLEKEVLEENEGGKSKESAVGEKDGNKAVEFWTFTCALANILDVHLAEHADTIVSSNGNSSSRPQSRGQLVARQKAVDLIMKKLESVLNELKQLKQQQVSAEGSRRRRWKTGGGQQREKPQESSITDEEAGESAV